MTNSPTGRLSDFWARHRTLFWSLHSVWAFATGVAVLFLARERYSFVPWVVVFLGLAWLSTMAFGRQVHDELESELEIGFGVEVTSYATRTLYQETLFFLLPFYAYSTVWKSPNVVFTGLLAALALFSCVDLVFDRWLRTRPVFGLIFFATVAFAAINLILPMVLGLAPSLATPLAALVAVGTAIPLAVRGVARERRAFVGPAVAALAILVTAAAFPKVIPPVPLRMQSATFAYDIDRETLELTDTVHDGSLAADMAGGLVVLVEVFAPANIPAEARLDWTRDGRSVRTSRTVQILAHEGAFRLWDRLLADSSQILPGKYTVTLNANDRVFGVATLELK